LAAERFDFFFEVFEAPVAGFFLAFVLGFFSGRLLFEVFLVRLEAAFVRGLRLEAVFFFFAFRPEGAIAVSSP
jgi:hypothetical protein